MVNSGGSLGKVTGVMHRRRLDPGRLHRGALVCAFGVVFTLVGCGEPELTPERILSLYQSNAGAPALAVTYPHDQTLFPPEIVAPIFRWQDDTAANAWLVRIDIPEAETVTSDVLEQKSWRPPAAQWELIKQHTTDRAAEVLVLGVERGVPVKVVSAASISVLTSRDEVGAPLIYREVNLPFIEAVKDPSKIRWRFGPISCVEQPPILLENLPVCGNCHSFSADGLTFGMDVDYANDKGSYAFTSVKPEVVLSPGEIITWSDFRRDDGEATYGLLSQVSPDGRYVVSTVKDRSVFVPKNDRAFSQLFFPIRGILAVYSKETGEFAALPGADDPEYVQSNPSWSPDGQSIVFARAPAYRLRRDSGGVLLTQQECDEFLTEGKEFKFDLYRVPFNEGRGGIAEPLPGASHNGRSNYFAKYSPDGRWIVFCRSDNYMLLQPDSELYIMPAEGGEARRLECNTTRMNSWHSWSPNGKWLVFSSKANTVYTQLYLAHIDEEGRASPPVLLEHFTASDRAANIPEFVNVRPAALTKIREAFLDDVSFVRAGDTYLSANEPRNAILQYRKALELNPSNAIAHSNLGGVLATEGRVEEALTHLNAALNLNPHSHSAHYNLARQLYQLNKIDDAIDHYLKAAEIKPDLFDAHYTVGVLLCARGNLDEGERHLDQAVKLNPNSGPARYAYGEALVQHDRVDEALPHLKEAVRLSPNDATARYCLGRALERRDDLNGALENLGLAVRLDPRYASAHHRLGVVLCRLEENEIGLQHLVTAARLSPGNPETLRDVAWGLARTGDFENARMVAEQALESARARGLTELATALQRRIELYADNRAEDSP